MTPEKENGKTIPGLNWWVNFAQMQDALVTLFSDINGASHHPLGFAIPDPWPGTAQNPRPPLRHLDP